jgi:hypothetical protein
VNDAIRTLCLRMFPAEKPGVNSGPSERGIRKVSYICRGLYRRVTVSRAGRTSPRRNVSAPAAICGIFTGSREMS